MAEQFVGLDIAVTLSNNAQLTGTVAKVDSTTQILHLREVVFLADGSMIPNWSIEASHIKALELVEAKAANEPPPPPPAPAEFIDPAIVSFSRKPPNEPKKPVPAPQPQHTAPAPPLMIRTASKPKPTSPLPDINQLETSAEPPVPGILPHPALLRPKPRKPPQPPSPSQLQVPNKSSRQQKHGNNTPRQRHRAHSRVSDSGWLTDEIVGGQVDDFDFETNLGKFDKRRVWEEFRKMDKTDPTSLLVYHNRTATAPKYTQNLSHKTNVIDDLASSSSSDDEPVPNRRGSRQTKRGTTSRKPSSAYPIGNLSGRNSVMSSRWRVVGDDTNSDVIPVTAEQMANAEKAALEAGMSEDALVENAGRGIAEAVISSLGGNRLDRKNHNPAPLVVVLAGNNRTGAYSLCAGRWLSLRGIRVLGVMCSGDEEELDTIRTQLNLFKNSGGRKVIPGDLQRTISALPSPPEIILDGLFGYLHSLEDLWDDEDKITCIDLIKWANSLRGRRMSIDKPSFANADLAIQAEWVIAVGAVKEDVEIEPGVRVFVVDLGLGRGIWKGVAALGGTGKRRRGILGINWDAKWVVELQMIA